MGLEWPTGFRIEFWERFQREHQKWQQANFGHQPAWAMLLGIVEETGEASSVHATPSTYLDAAADRLIFLTGLFSALGFEMRTSLERYVRYAPLGPLPVGTLGETALLGAAAHRVLKTAQGIRGSTEEHRAALEDIVSEMFWVWGRTAGIRALYTLAPTPANEWEALERLITDVWREVSLRNWKERPDVG